MKFNIRQALPDDAVIFADCQISCWQSAYKGIVSDEYLANMVEEKEQKVNHFREVLANPGECVFYCVMHAQTMAGFLIINKNRNGDTPEVGEIWAIYLIEEFCGKGFGGELLAFEIDVLKRHGCKKIYLWVFKDNIRARRFYEKNGFCFTGTERVVEYGGLLIQYEYMLSDS